jgi:hypothetical protein
MLKIISCNSSTTPSKGTVATVRGYRYKYKAHRKSNSRVIVTGSDDGRHLTGILEYADDAEEASRIEARMKKDKRIHHVKVVTLPDYNDKGSVKVIGR